jgi:hypothetical protein
MYIVHSNYTWCAIAYYQLYKRKTIHENNQSGEQKKGIEKRVKFPSRRI